jgi:peroxiredoxin
VTVEIGQPAPDFTLRSHTGDEVTLSQFEGQQPVALVFIPFAFTGVCEGELCAIRDDYAPFEAAGTQVLVITCDPAPSQKVWAAQQGFTFPLLSDFWPHGAVAQQYDAFNEALGCAWRKTVLVGKDGVVVDAFQSGGLGEARTADRYQEALARL